MPRVEVLTEVSERDHEAELTEHAPREMLANEHYADHLVERLGWSLVDAEPQTKEFHAHNGSSAAGAPARSVRVATARRAGSRRGTARSHQRDTEASMIEFLARHPGSTAGGLAKGLNLDPGRVAPA
jgi:hypothetical protein